MDSGHGWAQAPSVVRRGRGRRVSQHVDATGTPLATGPDSSPDSADGNGHEDAVLASAGLSPAPPVSATRPPSATRRVRARLARRMTAQRRRGQPGARAAGRGAPRALPEGRPGDCCSAPTTSPSSPHDDQMRKSGDPYITHPLAVANILGRARAWTPRRWSRRCCTTPSRTPATRSRRCAPSSATRSRHLVDGVTKLDKVAARHRGRGRDDPQDDHRDGARPARAGHQGRRPAAQHAHHALPAAGEAGPEGPRDAGSALRRWPIGSAWRRSSGSSRTCRSRSCTRRSTRRSSAWSPTGRRRATPTCAKVIDEISGQLTEARVEGRRSRAGRSTTGRSTRR